MNLKKLSNSASAFSHVRWKNIVPICIILCIVVLHGVINYAVLKRDTDIYLADEYNHFESACSFHDGVKELIEERNCDRLQGFFSQKLYHPRLFSVIGGAWLYIRGELSMDNVALTNVFYMFALLFSMYFIGRKVGGVGCGLLSAFILSMFPAVFAFSRVVMPEFSLLAFVALAYVFIVCGESLTKRRYSILLGITLGFGMFTKITYPAFVVMPLVLLLTKAMRLCVEDPNKRKTIIMNLSLVIVSASMVYSWWLVRNYYQVMHDMPREAFITPVGNGTDFYYIVLFCFQQLQPFFYVLFNIMVIILMWRGHVNFVLEMLASIVVPILIISIASAEETRFTIAMLPFAALLIARGLCALRSKLTIICVVIIALFQFGSLSNSENSLFSIRENTLYANATADLSYITRDNGLYYAQHEDWDTIYELYRIFKDYDKAHNTDGVRAYFVDLLFKTQWGIKYLARINRERWSIGFFEDWDQYSGLDNWAEEKVWILQIPFVIVRGDLSDDNVDRPEYRLWTDEQGRWRRVKKLFYENISDYILLQELNSEDGLIKIYKKKE